MKLAMCMFCIYIYHFSYSQDNKQMYSTTQLHIDNHNRFVVFWEADLVNQPSLLTVPHISANYNALPNALCSIARHCGGTLAFSKV